MKKKYYRRGGGNHKKEEIEERTLREKESEQCHLDCNCSLLGKACKDRLVLMLYAIRLFFLVRTFRLNHLFVVLFPLSQSLCFGIWTIVEQIQPLL